MDNNRRKGFSSLKGNNSLQINDRVVFLIEENTPEYGVVQWLGRVSCESSNGLMVGVRFDNAVGNDNHIVGGSVLFEAPAHHASVLPASSLIKATDFILDAPHYIEHSSRCPANNNKKLSCNKVESQLGGDMSSLTPFHLMAYEQLASGRSLGASGTGGMTMSPGYSDKDKSDMEILPCMTYAPHKSIMAGSKETLQDYKSKPRNKSRNSSSKHCSSDKRAGFNTNNISKMRSCNSSNTMSSVITEPDTPPPPPPPPVSYSDDDLTNTSLYNLTLHGIDQLEVVSDGDGSQYGTPEGSVDGEEDLEVGSMVEVKIKDVARYGVIRWIGTITGDKREGRKVAAVEMEDAEDGLSDGTFNGKRYFNCPPHKALFVSLRMCVKDSRFLESATPRNNPGFGSMDCQPVSGSVPPLSTKDDVRAMFGKNKGIQGHQNSCYLDATLFSMFAFTSVFDSILFRPRTPNDIREYSEVQKVLREEIVNPLRANMFVRADRIMKLRKLLDHLSSVRGLTTEEKDPEEFLHSLLAQILRAEPLLQLSSGQEAYHYQLFVDKDEKMNLPSVQTLFDQSFLTSDIKLKQVPSCLIIQMPRFGKDYKMYPRILPSMVLDITDVIEDSPRQCFICGKLAEFECRECFGQCGPGLESISFCTKCMDKAHSHKKRECHTSTRRLKVPSEFQMLADHCITIPRVYMELFAVVCIETSHYVTFTRCGSGADATWCFFDSMADRKGEQHGYNIPTVVECTDLMQWVGDEGSQMLHAVTDNKALPDLPRRLLCDAYMCFYQSPKIMMYR